MAREQVTIKIDTDANTGGIDKVERKLLALAAKAKLANAALQNAGIKTGKFGDALDDLDDSSLRAGKSTQKLGIDVDGAGKGFKKAGKAGKGLAGFLKTTYKFAMIGAGLETAGLALALSSVNGLLAIGKFAAKSYQVALSALAKGAAVAAIALATVAAAQRQFVAAQATGRYGGDYKASSAALRGMSGDARLAAVGMKGLNQAFAAASKNSKVTGATSGALAGLLDFAYASGDVEKGASSLANIISLIQKGEGLSSSKVTGAAKEIGPEFEKTYKEMIAGGKMTSGELIKMFSSGEFAKKAGISGASDAVQGSLLGQFKSFVTQMQVMFGDLGAQFIEPVQVAFEEIRRIVVRTFTAISPLVADYAKGGLLDKVVNGIDVISQFLVKLMQDYVPKSQGFFNGFLSFWDKVKSAFGSFTAYLQRFSAASKIINKFLGGIIKALGSGLKKNFEKFGDMVVGNEDKFLKFGDSIENLITKILDLFGAMREAFMKALPTLTTIANIIGKMVGGLSSIIRSFSKMGPLGALIGMVGPMMAMKAMTGVGGFGGFKDRMVDRGKRGANWVNNNRSTAALGAAAFAQMLPGPDIINDIISTAIVGAVVGNKIPLLGGGLGAAVATLGTVGYQAGDQLSDLAYRKTGGSRAASTATGALATGAAWAGAGAIVGNIIPIPGVSAAAGAIVGFIAGSIYGGIKGWMQDGKYKKMAREAAGKFVEGYSKIVNNSLGQNDLESAKYAMQEFGKYAKIMADGQLKSGTALDEANKQWEVQKDSLEGGINLMEARFEDLTKASGLTSEEITKLANSAEFSLANGMMTLQDVLAATGIATMRFGDDLDRYLTNAYATAVSNIRKVIDTLNAPKVANEAAIAFRDKAIAGTVETEDRAALLEALAQEQLIASGGDPLKAFETLYNNIGTRDGKQFDPTNIGLKDGKPILGVLTDTFGTSFSDAFFGGAVDENGVSEGQKVIDAFFGASGMGGATSGAAAENLVSGLAGIGYEGGSVEEITKMLNNVLTTQGMDPYMKLITSITNGEFLTPEMIQTPHGMSIGTDVETQLVNTLGSDFAANLQIQKTNEELLRASIDDLSLGMVAWVDAGDAFGAAVSKLDAAAQKIIDDGDTASPRRNMLNTMGKHSAFDAQIAGNRTMTSGFRTNALGSMSSDHAAGRAYDLVGQNLGLYGQAINKAGGFSEFHGNGSARHLHVVPGNGPVGDTATPYMGGSVMAPSSSNSNSTVNLVINATPNMDINALASEVMFQIERAQRSRNERY